MSVTIQLRRDTAANWASANPVLNQGELGAETDTGKAKLGDGATAWTSLAYWTTGGGAGSVGSVFGRTGVVAATSGDYSVAQVTGAASIASVSAETSRAETAEALLLAKASNLSDLASAATARTNLGLGTAATHPSTDFDAAGAAAAAQAAAEAASVPVGSAPNGAVIPKVVTLTQSGGNVAINGALGNDHRLALTASGWTIANPTGLLDGQDFTLTLTQDATGGRTLAGWGTAFDWGAGGSAPELSAAPSARDLLGFKFYADTGKCVSLGAAFPQGY